MKLLVIGHSVFDFINDGINITKRAGGIYYSVSALNRLASDEDEICLCSQYDDETYNHFAQEFDGINKKFSTKVDRIPRVYLNLFTDQERHEKYENISNGLNLKITDYNKFDGILINMITGYDISLEQLTKLRNQYAGLIYLDVHTLSRGLDSNYKRNFRLIPDFNSWAECIDILQVNQNELFTVSNKKSEIEIVNEILKSNIKAVCLTKGELGAKIYYKKSGEIYSYFIAANRIENPNVIGCGDVFGASFFYSYIRNNDVVQSLSFAVVKTEQFVKSKNW